MNIEVYRQHERLFREIEGHIWTIRWSYIHGEPERKEWGIQWCDNIYSEIKKMRLCNYASLSWEDSMTVDQENKPKEALGRGAFGATYTGD